MTLCYSILIITAIILVSSTGISGPSGDQDYVQENKSMPVKAMPARAQVVKQEPQSEGWSFFYSEEDLALEGQETEETLVKPQIIKESVVEEDKETKEPKSTSWLSSYLEDQTIKSNKIIESVYPPLLEEGALGENEVADPTEKQEKGPTLEAEYPPLFEETEESNGFLSGVMDMLATAVYSEEDIQELKEKKVVMKNEEYIYSNDGIPPVKSAPAKPVKQCKFVGIDGTHTSWCADNCPKGNCPENVCACISDKDSGYAKKYSFLLFLWQG